MAGVVASLWAKLGLDTDGFSKGINKAKRGLTTIRPEFSKAQLAAAAFAVGGIAYAGKRMFDLGAAVEETASKFRTVFGPETAKAQAFLDEFASAAGLSNQKAQDLLATTGAIVQGMGLAGAASRRYAEQVVRLAGDLSSFNNIPIEETSHAIQSAITGEREQLKRLGIVILETDVQKRALAETGKTVVGQLTQEEKAQATLALITERAGVAVGDLARTKDSAANRARKLAADIQTVKERLSASLMPAMEAVLGLLVQWVDKTEEWVRKFTDGITTLSQALRGVNVEFVAIRESIEATLAASPDKEGFLSRRLVADTIELEKTKHKIEELKQKIEDLGGRRVIEGMGDTEGLGLVRQFDAATEAAQTLNETLEYLRRKLASLSTAAAGAGAGAGGGGGGVTSAIANKARAALAERGLSVYKSAGAGNLPVTTIIAQDLQTIGSDEVQSRLQATMSTISGGLESARSAALGFGDAFANALVDSTTRGKQAFTDFANHVIREFQRILAQRAVFAILNWLLPGSGTIAGTVTSVINRENALDVSASIPRYTGG